MHIHLKWTTSPVQINWVFKKKEPSGSRVHQGAHK